MSISYFYFFKKNFSGDVPFILRCVTGDRFLDTLYVTPGTGSLTHFCDTEGPSGGSVLPPGETGLGLHRVNTTITLDYLHFALLLFACGFRGQ